MTFRILFVDDEPDLLLLYAAIVGAVDSWEVHCAESGEEALLKLDGGEFDLVICDMNMPGISGLQVLQKVADCHPRTRRLILTGMADPLETEMFRQLRHELLLKPLRPPALLAKIHELCRKGPMAVATADEFAVA